LCKIYYSDYYNIINVINIITAIIIIIIIIIITIIMMICLYMFLIFSVEPYIVSSPLREIQVQNVGESVKLNCSAGGLPLPKVKWFKDGSIISLAAQEDNDLINSNFVIHRFTPSDAGIYTCLFENDMNGTAEANTSLSMSTVYLVLFHVVVFYVGKRFPGFEGTVIWRSYLSVIARLAAEINASIESLV